MTLPVVWLPEADAELKEALAYYDAIRPELGTRFALAVVETIEETECRDTVQTGGKVRRRNCHGRHRPGDPESRST